MGNFKLTTVALGPTIFSRHLRIVNAVATLIASRSDRSTAIYFFFKLKLLILRRWWQLWMKWTTIKQRYWMNLFFVLFRSFVLRSFSANSMSKFSHNRCKCKLKLIMKTTAAYGHAQQQLYLCFSPLFCSPWYLPLKIILKQLFPSGLVHIGKHSPQLRRH